MTKFMHSYIYSLLHSFISFIHPINHTSIHPFIHLFNLAAYLIFVFHFLFDYRYSSIGEFGLPMEDVSNGAGFNPLRFFGVIKIVDVVVEGAAVFATVFAAIG